MADIVLSMDGLLLNWLKQVGDTVKKGDIIAEFEADKATVEVEAPADGTISALNGEIGEEMKEGAVIGQIGAGNGAAAAPTAPTAASNGQQAASGVGGSAADEIESELRGSGLSEIPSSRVGALAMDKLRAIDHIAYIRFASVYQSFEDLEDLKREVDSLMAEHGSPSRKKGKRTA